VVAVDQVVARAEGDQVRVVGRSGDADAACAAHVRVAQLVGELLEFVGRQAVVVPQHVVVTGAACALKN